MLHFSIKKCCKRIPLTISYYFLLLYFIQWDKYRQFWLAYTQTAHIGVRRVEHLFIYSTFVYNRRPAQNVDFGNIQMVVLFVAEKEDMKTIRQMGCILTDKAAKMTTQMELIGASMGVCALDLFLLTCAIDNVDRNSELFHDDGPPAEKQLRANMFGLELNNNAFGIKRRLNLNPMQPSYKPRDLVLCMSRVFLYEKWQLLITCIETYRFFKVDLVVAYVQSALLSVFELMKDYEKDGILKIQPGIRFPHLRGMKWDPNAETEFNSQILLAHECFYEYRESAQFIGLVDWDDLLVPSKHFPNLPVAFHAAFQQTTDAAYFLVNRLEASFVEQNVSVQSEFSMRRILEDGIRMAELYNGEKLVVRPKAIRGFWIHISDNVEAEKRPVRLLTNYSMILHVANDLKANFDEFRNPFMTNFDIENMHKQAMKLLQQFNKTKLPLSHPFFDALLQCHDQKSGGIVASRCLTYSSCAIPQLPLALCATTRSIFSTVVIENYGAQSVVIHNRERTEFDNTKCSEGSGI